MDNSSKYSPAHDPILQKNCIGTHKMRMDEFSRLCIDLAHYHKIEILEQFPVEFSRILNKGLNKSKIYEFKIGQHVSCIHGKLAFEAS